MDKGFVLTNEQDGIKVAVNVSKAPILAVESGSGTAKSKTLVFSLEDDNTPHRTALILAFNSKIAGHNKEDFPDWCEVRTLHSLGYKYVVGPLKLRVKNSSSIYDFKSKADKKKKNIWLSILTKYCQSSTIKVSEFLIENKYTYGAAEVEAAIKQVINDTENGKIDASHMVYIKLFQIHLITGSIDVPHNDLVILDEFQDAIPCYYSIFMNLKCNKRIGVGNHEQQLYKFAGADNAMQQLVDHPDAEVLSLSKSFRCSIDIARAVEIFCKTYIREDMTFTGSDYDDQKLETFCHQFRTNKSLINTMISHMKNGIKFSLARSVGAILDELIFFMIGVRSEYLHVINHGEHSKFYNDDSREIYEEFLSFKESNATNFYSYIKKQSKDSDYPANILRLSNTARDLNPSDVRDLKAYCKDESNICKDFVVSSAQSVKGLGFDCVFIDEDINDFTLMAIEDPVEVDSDTELFIYYTACTRSKKMLINAKLLSEPVNGDAYNYTMFMDLVKKNTQNKGFL